LNNNNELFFLTTSWLLHQRPLAGQSGNFLPGTKMNFLSEWLLQKHLAAILLRIFSLNNELFFPYTLAPSPETSGGAIWPFFPLNHNNELFFPYILTPSPETSGGNLAVFSQEKKIIL
jgi:hypothetical protein